MRISESNFIGQVEVEATEAPCSSEGDCQITSLASEIQLNNAVSLSLTTFPNTDLFYFQFCFFLLGRVNRNCAKGSSTS